MLLVLRVRLEHSGGWLVTLGPVDGQPASGRLSAAEGERLIGAVEALLQPPVVVVPGRVSAIEHAEEDAGRRLAFVFRPPALARAIAEHRGRAAAQGRRLLIAVDVEDEHLARLPWELLACGEDLPSLEAEGGAVVRLCRGAEQAGPPQGVALRALLWCPTPEEPACASALAGVQRGLEARGVAWIPVPGALPSLPDPEPDRLDVLVLICHGDYASGGPLLALDRGECAPGTVASALADGLGRVSAVLIGVCGGGAPSWAQLQDLAGRCLLAGAPCVLAPAALLSPEALVAFAAAWLPGLADQGLIGATRAGRQSVFALLTPHPDSRPWTFLLQVSALAQLNPGPWVPARWHPPALKSANSSLTRLLGRAAEEARRVGAGWVGLEHLLAIWRPEDGGSLATRLRSYLLDWDATLPERLRVGLERRPDWGEPLFATPRLCALFARCPEDARFDDLCRLLVEDPFHGLHLFAWRPLSALAVGGEDTYGPGQDSVSLVAPDPVPATRLQVLWGPEDGRVIRPDPGQTVGRHAEERAPDRPLYATGPALDRNLHRRQIRYDAPGEFTLLHRTELVRPGRSWRSPERLKGAVSLQSGDVLMPTPATWLRALP